MGCIKHENELRKKKGYKRKEELLWNQWEVIRVGLKIKGNRNKLDQNFKECEKNEEKIIWIKSFKKCERNDQNDVFLTFCFHEMESISTI